MLQASTLFDMDILFELLKQHPQVTLLVRGAI
jgi:hypothetical protein